MKQLDPNAPAYKTAEEIIDLMDSEMPYGLHPAIKPYMVEALKIYASQFIDLAAEKSGLLEAPSWCKPQVDKQSILSIKDLINAEK